MSYVHVNKPKFPDKQENCVPNKVSVCVFQISFSNCREFPPTPFELSQIPLRMLFKMKIAVNPCGVDRNRYYIMAKKDLRATHRGVIQPKRSA